MRAIMVMFDSLNRHMLPPYGCDWTHTPNFRRLADRCVTFDNSYISSMPCMPARRELHTGRPNFLHRSWGPLEPFDDSVPQMLHQNGTSSHLISDHYHYWETGGANYHAQYSTWQFKRGQEGDPWMGQVAEPVIPDAEGQNAVDDVWHRQDRINRGFMREVSEQPQSKTFAAGLEFIRRNYRDDNWFLQIETFDPHEPFFTQRVFQDLYPDLFPEGKAPLFDWPKYEEVKESTDLVKQCRGHYAALLSMCDASLGKILDTMDKLDLWKDTMLIVWTDHGFLLSEHGWWGKGRMPWFNHLANTPFFVWDPRNGKAGERRQSLVQPAIDLGPTLLDFFGLELTSEMRGSNLKDVIESDTSVRNAAIFGTHGGHVNVTDGKFVYMRSAVSPENTPLYNYTLMPAHMREMFRPEELQEVELTGPLPFSKGCRVMKIPTRGDMPNWDQHTFGTRLYDLKEDPYQSTPITNSTSEARMIEHLGQLMQYYDAPEEQFERLGL
ncbi:MAG: Choline-sulfatase [Candidatus Moanabacter tarae]|uniref:Choline-sulfatase n=1 Tax=Candidatus Moanibacter tarae TaxID=2200854 RepID=A0A2Z4AER5_9BACT|nr:MAG: Choline-sulfatase [Candidatus Moanabacter tarae]